METDRKTLIISPAPKPLTPEQLDIAGRALGAFLQGVWDAGGKGREIMERTLAEEAAARKAA